MPDCSPGCRVLLVLILAVAGMCPPCLALEEAPSLQADHILPKGMLSGPDYRVDPLVKSDGSANTYLLHSRFGQFRVVSTALLWTRIAEVKAMKVMDQVDRGKEMGNSIVESGKNTVKGAANLVIHPIDTLQSAFSGVGKMFSRADESLFQSNASQYEDNTTKALIGFSSMKREYALAFMVDPYSTNPELQKRLERVATAGYAGGISVTAVKVIIPGGVGLAVSSVSGATWLTDVDLSQPPTDLRRQNRQKLLDMGVAKELAEEFINNEVYTPTQQSLLVAALDTMGGVKDRDRFIRLAKSAASQDETLSRQRTAQLLAQYHRNVEKTESLVSVGRFVAARTGSGKIILAMPSDYLAWTAANAGALALAKDKALALGAAEVQLWVSGQASPMSRRELNALQVALREDADNALRR